MIDGNLLYKLTRQQLRQLRRIDFDCGELDCSECPLAIMPQQARTKQGAYFTYSCVSAFAAHILENMR